MTSTITTTADQIAALLAQIESLKAQEKAENERKQRIAVLDVARAALSPKLEAARMAYESLKAEMDALDAQYAELAPAQEPQQPETIQPVAGTYTGGETNSRHADGTLKARPDHFPMRFFQAFARKYKAANVTQKELTAFCRANGVNQADRSPENLKRAYDKLVAAGQVKAA